MTGQPCKGNSPNKLFNMEMMITNGWYWLCITVAVTLLTAFIMSLQGKQFFTMGVVMRTFSILDLEFPSSSKDIPSVIKGIYALPAPQQQQTLQALRGQLWLDFLFMPAAYGSIFLLCMEVAGKMNEAGQVLFVWLAWLQAVPWLFDIIENIYLLRKMRPDIACSSNAVHKAYQVMEAFKWGISLTGFVFALSSLLFFWLTGNYAVASLRYLLILAGEAAVFAGLQFIPFGRRSKA